MNVLLLPFYRCCKTMGKKCHSRTPQSKKRRRTARKKCKKYQSMKSRETHERDSYRHLGETKARNSSVPGRSDDANSEFSRHPGETKSKSISEITSSMTCDNDDGSLPGMSDDVSCCNSDVPISELDSELSSSGLFENSSVVGCADAGSSIARCSDVGSSNTGLPSPFVQTLQQMPGFAECLKESYSKDPLEVGYLLWRKNSIQKKKMERTFNYDNCQRYV